MPRVREIQFIDEDGTARGSVTNLEAIKLLTQHSELLRLSRNKRSFENYAKKNAEGVLRVLIPKLLIDDEVVSDLVDFLNGEPIYKYNNVQEAHFKNRVISYGNIGSKKDFGGNIYQALQYFMLPESKIKKIFESRIIFPRTQGEYENTIEQAMNERRQFMENNGFVQNVNSGNINFNYVRLNATNRKRYNNARQSLYYSPTYQFPPETRTMTNTQYEAWLRSGGMNTLRNYQERFVPENNQNNGWGVDPYEEALMNQFNSGNIGIGELGHLWRHRGGAKTRSARKVRHTRKRKTTRRR
jgi:hypothetical protein